MNNVLPSQDSGATEASCAARATSLAAELSMIGAYFIQPKVLRDIAGIIKPAHFTDPQLAEIFTASLKLLEMGTIANPITLRAAGFDPGVLIKIAELGTTAINAREYARLIRDLALKRNLSGKLHDTLAMIESADVTCTADSVRRELEGWLFDAFADSGGEDEAQTIKALTDKALADAELAWQQGGTVGAPTGLADLDRMLGGLFPGDLTVIAGRPGMGKTALALGIARSVANQKKTALIFSLEMSGDQLALREIAAQSGTTVADVRAGKIDQGKFDRMMLAGREISGLPILISSRPRLDMSAIAAECARVKRRYGLGLVIVDYAQLIDAEGTADNRVGEITYITGRLKRLAREFKCPVVALSQLSRAVESRDDKRPQLSDLRESGSIEQDADTVWFIYRRAYYLSREEPRAKVGESEAAYANRLTEWRLMLASVENIAEINIAKNRHGKRTRYASIGAASRCGSRITTGSQAPRRSWRFRYEGNHSSFSPGRRGAYC